MDFSSILEDAKKTIDSFKESNPDWVVVIWWATATWKSRLSVELSQFFPMEVISSDSRQIFRKMDIWTDKISSEIRKKIPHHQIDIVDPDQTYTAWEWKDDSEKIIDDILVRWKFPFIVWWTWLYIDTIYRNYSMPECSPHYDLRAELEEKEKKNPGILHQELMKVDPEEAAKLHPNSIRYIIRALEIFHVTWKTKTEGYIQQPVRHPLLMLWLWRDKETTNQLINARIKEMFKMWLVDEVDALLKEWFSPSLQSMQWIWYKEVVRYLQWEYNYEKMEEYLKRDTHHLAKKQRTWFRRYIAEWIQSPKENVMYKVRDL